MSDGPQEQPDPADKSLGDKGTDTDASRGDEARSIGEQGTGTDASKVVPAESLGEQSTSGDALSSISDLSDLSADFDDEMPIVDLSERYDIQQSIGKGGMGEVWLAVHKQLNRSDAIKRINRKSAGSRKAAQRFLAEAKAIAAIRHFNIVQIYDYGRDADGPFIIMEFVEGGSLLDRLKTGPLHLKEAIDLTCQLCDALSIAHEAGIIHRDIKPANILLTEDGVPKLTDFGLARQAATEKPITKTGTVVGTVHYMSPEQRRDATTTDERSDIWSLAATAYQLITGHVQVIDLETIPANLRKVFSQALKQQPDERFSTSEEFKIALQKSLSVAMATSDVDFEPGVCLVCNTTNAVNRKFCGNPECIAPLQADCMACSEKIPIWDTVCGECGEKQPELVAQRQAQLQEQRQQAESLRREYKYQEAQQILRPILELDDVRFSAEKNKATEMSATIEAEHQEQISQCKTIVEQARLALADCQFESSTRLLEGIAEPLRDESTVQLLQQSQSKIQERDHLRAEIKQQVTAKDLKGLLKKVRRLLELVPDHSAATKLQTQLERHVKAYLARAFDHVANGEHAKAIADYNEAIRLDPTDAVVYHNRGFAYDKKREFDQAIADYTEAIRINPDYATAYHNRGSAYDSKGEFEKAIADYTGAIRLDPTDAVVYHNRGFAYDKKREFDQAIADYNEAIRLDPTLAKSYVDRGYTYYKKREYDQAIADYTEAIRINPDYATAYNNRGFAYAAKGDNAKAEADSAKVRELEKHLVPVLPPTKNLPDEFDQGGLEFGFDVKSGVDELVNVMGWIYDYTDAIELDPTLAVFYNTRGFAYAAKGEFDQAIADYTEAIRINPDYATAYNNRGFAYDKKGEFEKAIADYTEAIRINPDYATAYHNRGSAHDKKGEFATAIADYTGAIRINPTDAVTYNNRGGAYDSKGEFEKAIADYNEAIRINPDYATAYNNRGFAYAAKGEFDQAIAHYNEAIRINPDYATAYNTRGFAYAAKGEFDQAIADYTEAIRINPDYATAYNNRGLAYDKKGEFEKAIADYTEAIRLDPTDTVVYHNRGFAYDKKGDKAKADADLAKAKELGYEP